MHFTNLLWRILALSPHLRHGVHPPTHPPTSWVANEQRRNLSAMVGVMDEAAGNVTRALKDAGLWDDTIFVVLTCAHVHYGELYTSISTLLACQYKPACPYLSPSRTRCLHHSPQFSTDNGGPQGQLASNFPLKGGKGTLWEGGVRGIGFVAGGNLTRVGIHGTPRVSHDLAHISDWNPTLCDFAGGLKVMYSHTPPRCRLSLALRTPTQNNVPSSHPWLFQHLSHRGMPVGTCTPPRWRVGLAVSAAPRGGFGSQRHHARLLCQLDGWFLSGTFVTHDGEYLWLCV